MTSLSMAEELFLLALNDKHGSIYTSVSPVLNYGLTGAEILELLINKRLALDNKCLIVIDPSFTNDKIKDEIITKIACLDKPRKPDYWISKLTRDMNYLKNFRIESLEKRDILQTEFHRIWGIFSVKRYIQRDYLVKESIKKQLHDMVTYDTIPDIKVICLLILSGFCGLINKLFNGEERKSAYHMIKDWMKKDVAERNDYIEVLNAIKKVIAAVKS